MKRNKLSKSVIQESNIFVLVGYKKKLFPFYLSKPVSKKFKKMAGESAGCGGGIGEFFDLIYKEIQEAATLARKACRGDEEAEKVFRIGFQIEVDKECEGNFLYRIKETPMKGDGQ